MEALLRSKKGCAAIIACIFACYGTRCGWTIEQILVVSGPLTAYIGIEGTIDHRKAKFTQPPVSGTP